MPRIYLRGKVWYGDYWQDGKRKRIPLSEKRPVAQRMMDDIQLSKRAMRNGLMPRDISWEGFRQRYSVYSKSNKKPKSAYRDELGLQMLERSTPVTRLTQVTPELLGRAVALWQELGKGVGCIARAVSAVKAAMHKAEEWGFIAPQSWRSVRVRQPAARLLYYTMQEYEGLLKVCRGRWLTAALLMGRSGLRSAEVRHLEWDDIDFDRQTLYIHDKEGWAPKGSKPNHPKNRVVDMPEDLQAYLQSLSRGQGYVLGPDLVSDQVWCTYFRRLIKKAGLKGSPHTLRHTYASHLVSNGVGLKAVGELLGHSDLRTTQIYAHLMPHARRKAVDQLPKLVVPVLCLGQKSNEASKGMARNGLSVVK